MVPASLSWRLSSAPAQVGCCSSNKRGEAVILPPLTDELEGKSSDLHNTRCSPHTSGMLPSRGCCRNHHSHRCIPLPDGRTQQSAPPGTRLL